MGHKKYCVISGILFSIVALAHLIRVVYGVPVYVDEFMVPMFVSWGGFIVPATLSIWAFRISRGPDSA